MDNTLPLIGRDIPYDSIRQEWCYVKRIELLAHVADNGEINSLASGLPYGFLEVECHTFKGSAMLLITHKIDFMNLWQATEVRGLGDGEELLVAWTDANYKNWLFKLFKRAMPKMVIGVCHKNAHKYLFNKDYMPHISGEARYQKMAPIKEYRPEAIA